MNATTASPPLRTLVVLIVLIFLAWLTPLRAHMSSQHSLLVDLKPVNNNSWSVNIIARFGPREFNCSGLVVVNAFYRETRSISRDLLVAPLYYVLDSACPQLTSYLASVPGRENESISIVFNYPPSYFFLSSMDMRGVGSSGFYTLPLSMFLSYYIYDGIVLASTEKYIMEESRGLRVVVPRGQGVNPLYIVEAVSCVSSYLRRELGPSPRSPVAIIVAPLQEHEFVLPGTGYSLGSILYVKPSPANKGSIVHLVAHETVHGWIGRGPLGGDEALVEGAAELLALIGLKECSSDLYDLAYRHVVETADMNKYYSWFMLHSALRDSSIRACGSDLYLEALQDLYSSSTTSTLAQLLHVISRLATEKGCSRELAFELGQHLLSGITEMAWSDNTSKLVHVRHAQSGKASTTAGQSAGQETSHASETVTITVRETITIIEECHEYTSLAPMVVVAMVFAVAMLILLARLVKKM